MKIERWSNECRERGADELEQVPSGDVRYLAQWSSDCERFGQCDGIDAFTLTLSKKYRRDLEVMPYLLLPALEIEGDSGFHSRIEGIKCHNWTGSYPMLWCAAKACVRLGFGLCRLNAVAARRMK